MSGISYSDLRTQIRNYTEVSSTVLSDSIIENIVLNAEYRIFRDVPLDAYRTSTTGNLVTNQDYVNVPAGALVVRGVQVYDSTSVTTGSNVAKAAGYSITIGKRDSSGNITNTTDFYHFTVDTDTATSGSESGGGENCSAGPATLTA